MFYTSTLCINSSLFNGILCVCLPTKLTGTSHIKKNPSLLSSFQYTAIQQKHQISVKWKKEEREKNAEKNTDSKLHAQEMKTLKLCLKL